MFLCFSFFWAMSSLCMLILTPNFRCVCNNIFQVNSLICVLYDVVAELHSVECKVVIPFQTCFIGEFGELGHKIRTSFINYRDSSICLKDCVDLSCTELHIFSVSS